MAEVRRLATVRAVGTGENLSTGDGRAPIHRSRTTSSSQLVDDIHTLLGAA